MSAKGADSKLIFKMKKVVSISIVLLLGTFSAFSQTGQRTTDPQNCKNLQNAYSGHIATINSIFREWNNDIAYDIKHNQYNRTNRNRQLLEENLRGIENCKKTVSKLGCSVQYNSSIENEARKKANFRPNW